jgi:hypothetical protein
VTRDSEGADAITRVHALYLISVLPQNALAEAVLALEDILAFESAKTAPMHYPRMDAHGTGTGSVVSMRDAVDLLEF